MKTDEYTTAMEWLNRMMQDEAVAEDKMLARDLRRASQFLQSSGYNPLAGAKNPQNVQIMSQYKKMIEIAMRKSDERIATSNERNMAIINNMLRADKKIR